MAKNNALIPIVAVAVVIAAAGAYYFMSSGGQTLQTPASETGSGGKSLKGSEVFETAVSWSEERRLPSGILSFGVQCDQDGTCSDVEPAGLMAENYLYDAYLEGSGFDSSYGEKADAQFGRIMQLCGSQGTCGFDSIPAVAARYSEGGDPAHRDVMIGSKETWLETADVSGPDAQFVWIRSMAAVYGVDADERLLSEARRLSESLEEQSSERGAVQIYQEGAAESIDDYACLSGLAKMHVYGMSSDGTLLSEARALVDAGGFADRAKAHPVLERVLDCAELEYRIYEATGEGAYRQGALDLLGHAVGAFWTGDGFKSALAADVRSYITPDAARIASLAAKFHGEEFELGGDYAVSVTGGAPQ